MNEWRHIMNAEASIQATRGRCVVCMKTMLNLWNVPLRALRHNTKYGNVFWSQFLNIFTDDFVMDLNEDET